MVKVDWDAALNGIAPHSRGEFAEQRDLQSRGWIWALLRVEEVCPSKVLRHVRTINDSHRCVLLQKRCRRRGSKRAGTVVTQLWRNEMKGPVLPVHAVS